MNKRFRTLKHFMRLCLFLTLGCTLTSAQTEEEGFEPRSGQAGKDVVWVPTSPELVEVMLDLAKVTPDDYLIDLGSGDGRTVIAAAKRGIKALGIEYNPQMVELSKQNAEEAGVSDKATFAEQDLFETDFSDATVITMFLLTSLNVKLRPTLLDLKPGTRIVSNTFTMEEWDADEISTLDELYVSWDTALLWIVPAKVGGTWKLPSGTLTLEQKFQMLSGTLTTGNSSIPIMDGRMRGTEISFSTEEAHYTGKVENGKIEGIVLSNGNNRTWNAVLSPE
ncbi:SAM-dependent methyltransferase [Candidatus Latescibacterota bacterium]